MVNFWSLQHKNWRKCCLVKQIFFCRTAPDYHISETAATVQNHLQGSTELNPFHGPPDWNQPQEVPPIRDPKGQNQHRKPVSENHFQESLIQNKATGVPVQNQESSRENHLQESSKKDLQEQLHSNDQSNSLRNQIHPVEPLKPRQVSSKDQHVQCSMMNPVDAARPDAGGCQQFDEETMVEKAIDTFVSRNRHQVDLFTIKPPRVSILEDPPPPCH